MTLMNNILITGGAGFIGSNFVNYWIKRYPSDKITVLDALTYAGSLRNLTSVENHPNYTFIKGNIIDFQLLSKIFKDKDINILVHFAAESHVDRSIADSDPFIETNIVGTHQLLKAAKQAWLDNKYFNSRKFRFHHISTDEVHGSLSLTAPAFSEITPYAPTSSYSASKAAADHLVRAYQHTHQLPTTISICSNNYGPNQHDEKFIPTVIRCCLQQISIPIYGNGTNIRDWLYVEDHCRAIELILNEGEIGETYHVGGNCEMNNIEMANLICEIFDELRPLNFSHKKLLTFVEDRKGHDWRYAVNTSKMQEKFSWKQNTDIKAMLKNMIAKRVLREELVL